MLARHLRHSLRLAACLAVASPFAPTIARSANPAPPSLASCTAAGCINTYWGAGQIAAGFGPNLFRPGQTFVPQFSGVLNTVRLGLETQTNEVAEVMVEIRTVANGLPTSTILAQAPVPAAHYAGGVIYSADFTRQNLVLTAGTPYAIVLRSTEYQHILGAFPPCPPSSGASTYVHSYDGGVTWAPFPDRSFIFEVCMDAATPVRAATWGRLKAIYR